MGELLGRELPGPDDDFFALGGDSLLAIALVGRLRALGHAGLDVGAVFARRTARALAAALADATGPALPAIAPREGSALAPLTGAQRRGWLFGEMNPGARAYQHAGMVRIDGALDTAALRTALEALVDRHEALRSSIVVARRRAAPARARAGAAAARGARPARGGLGGVRAHRSFTRADAHRPRRGAVGALDADAARRRALGAAVASSTTSPTTAGRSTCSRASSGSSTRRDDRRRPRCSVGDFARLGGRQAEEVDAQLGTGPTCSTPIRDLLELPATARAVARVVRRRLGAAAARARPRRRLRSLAAEEGATPSGRPGRLRDAARPLCRSDDVQVGTGVANRRDPACRAPGRDDRQHGALRIDLSGDPTVRGTPKRARATVIDAIANADVPFDARGRCPRRRATGDPLAAGADALLVRRCPARRVQLGRASTCESSRPCPTAAPRPTST